MTVIASLHQWQRRLSVSEQFCMLYTYVNSIIVSYYIIDRCSLYRIEYRIAGKFGGGRFGELTRSEHLAKESLTN